MIDFPIIDSHIHLLDQKRFGYAWAKGASALKRDWTPDDLARSAEPYEIEGLVFVEVDVDMPQYLDEADWVDGLARRDRRVLGAVVCLPLERGDESTLFYDKWMADRIFLQVPAQVLIGKWLESFKEFPPRSKPASFSIGQVVESMMPKS